MNWQTFVEWFERLSAGAQFGSVLIAICALVACGSFIYVILEKKRFERTLAQELPDDFFSIDESPAAPSTGFSDSDGIRFEDM